MTWNILEGDCVGAMQAMEAGSVDAVVCDPPYGLEFMGKEWDKLERIGFHAGREGPGFTEGGTVPLPPTPSFSQGRGKRCDACGRYAGGNDRINCRCERPQFRNVSRGAEQEAWHLRWSLEAFRVLKPGGHLLAFGGTRTYHRLVCALEDAGFEIRDCLAWLYGSGFPKSLDVSKAIDRRGGQVAGFQEFRDAVLRAMARGGVTRAQLTKALGNHMVSHYLTNGSQPAVPVARDYRIIRDTVGLGDEFDHLFLDEAERKVVRTNPNVERSWRSSSVSYAVNSGSADLTDPATDQAQRWEGWGTALKPAHEPIVLARKPLSGTVAGNVLEHGTGGLNVDGCRIEGTPDVPGSTPPSSVNGQRGSMAGPMDRVDYDPAKGRWPANVILDEPAAALLDEQTGVLSSGAGNKNAGDRRRIFGTPVGALDDRPTVGGDSGGASRFFYTAKASRAERNAGLEGFESDDRRAYGNGVATTTVEKRVHPTPSGLGAWLRAERERAGLSVKDVAAHFPSRTGGLTGCVWNWENGANVPTPDEWRTLQRVIGFDNTHDEAMVTVAEFPADDVSRRFDSKAVRNHHPTVKPVSLMRWLVRLVTPPGGLVLDPFAGSGTTGVAAVLEGFRFLGVEREPEYVDLARARVAWWLEHGEDALRIVSERERAEAERAAVAETGQLDLGVV